MDIPNAQQQQLPRNNFAIPTGMDSVGGPHPPRLTPADFQREMSWAIIWSHGREFQPKAFYDWAAGEIEHGKSRDECTLEAAKNAQSLYCIFEDELLSQDGLGIGARGSLIRQRYGDAFAVGTGAAGVDLAHRVVVDAAVNAVYFHDENYLAFAQEHSFGLGDSLSYRAALAAFLRPPIGPVTPERRRADILSASDPIKCVRAAVRGRAGVIRYHGGPVERARPLALGKCYVLSLGDTASAHREDDEDFSEQDRTDRYLAQRGALAVPETCRELGEQEWAEIGSRLDERTAGELRAWLAGGHQTAADCMHFRRQLQKPSRLHRLVREWYGNHEAEVAYVDEIQATTRKVRRHCRTCTDPWALLTFEQLRGRHESWEAQRALLAKSMERPNEKI